MLNRWNESLAAQCVDELSLRAYSSRLLGAEPSLILHGGGNTSVKIDDTLWVKGSGADLAQVTPGDFTPVALAAARDLLRQAHLDNDAMMHALGPLVRESGRPKPSIETLLHASLPFRYVEHTHADAILALTNTRHGEAIAARVFGDSAPQVPFRQSGFDLAMAGMEAFDRDATQGTIGLLLLRHGVFAFGASAREAYENMLSLVTRAEDYLQARQAWNLPVAEDAPQWAPLDLARLRRDICLAAGLPLLARLQDDPQTLAFARREDLETILEEGPATPQHAVFIKRVPMVGGDVTGYVQRYRAYVAGAQGAPDPAPRLVLDPAYGALVLGYGPDYLAMGVDIFRHGREIMTRASAHDHYEGLPPDAILEAEIHYGGFERRLRQGRAPRDTLRGLCVGIADTDGERTRELARSLQDHGAAVMEIGEDTSPAQVVRRFGGLDALITATRSAPAAPAWQALLALAPFGGKQLNIHQPLGDLLQALTPP